MQGKQEKEYEVEVLLKVRVRSWSGGVRAARQLALAATPADGTAISTDGTSEILPGAKVVDVRAVAKTRSS